MKPAVFDYYDPGELTAALTLLQLHSDTAQILAGGQSLVPLMNFRLAKPALIVDINRLQELSYIRVSEQRLMIGAITRQVDVERSPVIAAHWPLLIEAIRQVGHLQIRNRGTIGGSVAHADPAAELPCAFLALDAQFHVMSADSRGKVAAEEFFVDLFTTAIKPGELLVEIEVPPTPEGTGHAFVEFARRHGDFALAGAAALLTFDSDRRCTRARLTLLGAGQRPARARRSEQILQESVINDDLLEESAAAALDNVSPTGDIHGSGEYRTHLLRVVAKRALTIAAERARALVT